MLIDPMTSLAYGMHAKKGIYALILGSGVSMRANIPTGWEILNDLIRRITKLQNREIPDDPYGWYTGHYGEEPDYSKLIEALAKTPAERNMILRNYFEKAEGDAEGDKEPTLAHRSIARLVKQEYIRVIITTNFDRLLEDALKDEGVSLDVISSSDHVRSAMPLIHSRCTIIKVNGDYMDTRIKNTFKELEYQNDQMDELLIRVFDEFGIVVCGWSARWDFALREAMYRSTARRFTTYWMHRGSISPEASGLIDFRYAEKIEIADADAFFASLEAKLISLSDLQTREHPLSLEMACVSLKKWLPDPMNSIQIHDMIIEEAHAVSLYLKSVPWLHDVQAEDIRKKISDMDAVSVKLLHMLALGCFWGVGQHNHIWKKALEILMAKKEQHIGNTLYNYLPLQALYVILVGALANEKYDIAYTVLHRSFYNEMHKRIPLNSVLHNANVLDYSMLNYALGLHHEAPVSEHLYEVLYRPCIEVIHVDDIYEVIFDKAEYLIALNYKALYPHMTGPRGRFFLKKRMRYVDIDHLLADDIDGLLKAGFFGGRMEVYNELCSAL